MTRTIFAIAMAFCSAATIFSSAANACISCEYVPPVVNTPVYSHGDTHYRQRSYSATTVRRAKKHIAKTPRVKSVEPTEAAAAKPVQKPANLDTASITKDERENSSITTAKADDTAPETTPETKTSAEAQAGTCKKFFASVGMTLTVPCE